MSERNEKQISFQNTSLNLDAYTITKDIRREWVTILLLAVSVGMIVHMVSSYRYQPSYTTRTTLFVTTRGTSNSIYNNQYSAGEAATKFSQILNSNLLKKKVAKEMGLSGFQGSASANVIENTNLLQVEVTAATPELSFKQMQAILKNYNQVSDYLLGDAILEVLQAPEVPTAPDTVLNTTPMVEKAIVTIILGMSLLLGIFSYMKDTIRTEKDVEQKLDTKRLVTIAHENKYKTIKAKIRGGKTSILLKDPTVSFRYVETLKKLSGKVINLLKEKKGRTILVTSVLENEGKSTVAANLALALAQESHKVLLIDCDFRKPAQFKVLRMQHAEFSDFGNVLNGTWDVENLVKKVPDTNLYTILNAVAFPNATELIGSGILKKVIEFFREEMDYIVIDTAPIALVADVEEMVSMVDSAILVVRQHMVEAKDLNDAIDLLNGEDSKLLGCVFNNVHLNMVEKAKMMGYGYEYGGHYEQ